MVGAYDEMIVTFGDMNPDAVLGIALVVIAMLAVGCCFLIRR